MRRHDCARDRAHKTISARDEKTTDEGTWPPNRTQHRSLATAAGRGTTQGVPWCWNPGCVRARCRKQRETSASRNPETGRNALRGVRPWRNSEKDAVRIEAGTRDAQELQGDSTESNPSKGSKGSWGDCGTQGSSGWAPKQEEERLGTQPAGGSRRGHASRVLGRGRARAKGAVRLG
jgi:hypothetical protein